MAMVEMATVLSNSALVSASKISSGTDASMVESIRQAAVEAMLAAQLSNMAAYTLASATASASVEISTSLASSASGSGPESDQIPNRQSNEE